MVSVMWWIKENRIEGLVVQLCDQGCRVVIWNMELDVTQSKISQVSYVKILHS